MRRLAAMTLPAPSTAMTPSTMLSSTRWSNCADGGAPASSAGLGSAGRTSEAAPARLSVSSSTTGQCTLPPAALSSPDGGSVQTGWTAATKDSVGSRLQVGVDVFDVWLDVAIARESLHDRIAVRPSRQHDLPEGRQIEGRLDQRRGERAADAIGTVTVDADGVVAAVSVVGPFVGLAVHDPVELALCRAAIGTGRQARVADEQAGDEQCQQSGSSH